MARHFSNVIVTNFHRRLTGVTATITSLVAVQRRLIDVGVIDAAGLGLENEWSLIKVAMAGFRQPVDASYRVWHAPCHNEILAGIILRDVLFQRWKTLCATASAREPGRFTRFLLGRMDVEVAASRSSARSRARDSAIVHHGVDCSVFRPQSAEDIGSSTAMFPGKQVIGFVGRIRHAKGADTFVSAMLDILPEHRDCVAVLAGACLARHEAFKADQVARINAVGLDDRIVFLDEIGQDELIKLYQKMTIHTACSRHK